MARTPITTRPGELSDSELLAELWAPTLRRADHHDQLRDIELIIKAAGVSPEQRLLIAEYDGTPAGSALLRATTISTVNLEPCVQVISPTVLPQFRRRGVGRALFEAGVDFADELGIAHLATAARSGSREANRFLARLGLGPQATLRVAPTHVVRAKLTPRRPGATADDRHLPRLLAARRSMRRTRARG